RGAGQRNAGAVDADLRDRILLSQDGAGGCDLGGAVCHHAGVHQFPDTALFTQRTDLHVMASLDSTPTRPDGIDRLLRHLPSMRKGIGLVLLAALAFVFLIPILWMTVMSFQAGEKMFQLRTEWIPTVWHLENYPNAISRAPFVQYFINSGIVAL
ncbi:hypothetical protein CEE80_12725, partial [Lactobacillus crispatus]